MRIVHRLMSIGLFAMLAMGVLYLATCGKAFADTATVTWTHPVQRVDGTALPLAEIKSTRIGYGLCPSTATTVDVPAPAATWTSPQLGYGTWCFVARTIDTADRVSDPTNPVQKVVLAPPKPPVIVTVNLTAYEIKLHPVEGVLLGRAVGTVPLGTPCTSEQPVVGSDFHIVPRSAVTLTKVPKSDQLVAQCAVVES